MGIRTTQELRIDKTDRILTDIKNELHDMNHGIKNLTEAIRSMDDAYRMVNNVAAKEVEVRAFTDDN